MDLPTGGEADPRPADRLEVPLHGLSRQQIIRQMTSDVSTEAVAPPGGLRVLIQFGDC